MPEPTNKDILDKLCHIERYMHLQDKLWELRGRVTVIEKGVERTQNYDNEIRRTWVTSIISVLTALASLSIALIAIYGGQ